MSVQIILPCAGEGKRLGLPYPKEIHQVANDVSLIDLNLRTVYAHRDQVERIALTITPNKTQLVSYMAKWKSVYPLAFTFFDDQYFEWAGSIRSAQHLFADKNVVLLPDSNITERPEFRIIPTMNAMLEEYGLVFGYIPEISGRLSALGALKVADDGRTVLDFCDKPGPDTVHTYNGFWGTFGFRKEYAVAILELMTASIQRQRVDLASLGIKVGAFPLERYEDLGTWNNIFSYQRQF
jgi:hypothetical protein